MEISLSSAVSIGVGIYTFFSSKSTPFNDVEYNIRKPMRNPPRVKLGTKTGPTFQYSLFKGFYITKKYHINIYYTTFKLFIHFGYIDIKIDN